MTETESQLREYIVRRTLTIITNDAYVGEVKKKKVVYQKRFISYY